MDRMLPMPSRRWNRLAEGSRQQGTGAEEERGRRCMRLPRSWLMDAGGRDDLHRRGERKAQSGFRGEVDFGGLGQRLSGGSRTSAGGGTDGCAFAMVGEGANKRADGSATADGLSAAGAARGGEPCDFVGREIIRGAVILQLGELQHQTRL